MLLKHLSRLFVSVAMCGACMGSSCFDGDATNSGGGGIALTSTLEITVDGTHVGPSTIESGSNYTVVNTTDEFGNIQTSTLTVHDIAASMAFDITLQRFGSDVNTFAPAEYTVTQSTGTTSDRVASPVGNVSVTAGNLNLLCGGGDDCDGEFTINSLDTSEISGYFNATMESPQTGDSSSVVVSFYAPGS